MSGNIVKYSRTDERSVRFFIGRQDVRPTLPTVRTGLARKISNFLKKAIDKLQKEWYNNKVEIRRSRLARFMAHDWNSCMG